MRVLPRSFYFQSLIIILNNNHLLAKGQGVYYNEDNDHEIVNK
jgi:hypothetical protein